MISEFQSIGVAFVLTNVLQFFWFLLLRAELKKPLVERNMGFRTKETI